MIKLTLDKERSILHVKPLGPLAKDDFDHLASEVDPYIDETGNLEGLILEITKFPGWENFGAAIRHFRFVRDHHKRIRKVAVVTDSFIGTMAESVTSHFISAQVRRFDSDQLESAKEWIAES